MGVGDGGDKGVLKSKGIDCASTPRKLHVCSCQSATHSPQKDVVTTHLTAFLNLYTMYLQNYPFNVPLKKLFFLRNIETTREQVHWEPSECVGDGELGSCSKMEQNESGTC